ncbi:MAG: DUF1269 domain-containing protein [Candidatus Saccharibacteria bacterium]|nr:DUF1269 domain-containing protein [Candidatus Saccharibacteria bacterium]
MTDQGKNMFLYVAAYSDESTADEDFEFVKELNKEGWVGSYDAGIVSKDNEGKLAISRHTDSTGKGARRGLVIGAVLGVIFPPSILASGLVGVGAGAAIGHSMNDVSKDDLEEIGELLKNNESAIVVLGESKVKDKVRELTKQAIKEYQKEFNSDVADYNKAMDEISKEV